MNCWRARTDAGRLGSDFGDPAANRLRNRYLIRRFCVRESNLSLKRFRRTHGLGSSMSMFSSLWMPAKRSRKELMLFFVRTHSASQAESDR